MYLKEKGKIIDQKDGMSIEIRQDALDRTIFYKKLVSKTKTNSLKSEAQILNALNNKKIRVPMLYEYRESYRDGNNVYELFMEYIPNKTLDRLISENVSLSILLEYFLQLCILFNIIHKKNLRFIHKDLKPQNILIPLDSDNYTIYDDLDKYKSKKMKVILIDFDISNTNNTNLGTHIYMPPEFTQNSKSAHTMQSDIYSMGIIFYYLFMKTPPTEENLVPDSYSNNWMFRDKIQCNCKYNMDEINKIYFKCTNYDKNKRYNSYYDLIVDVERVTKNERN